jgi:hypothetical protein
VAVQLGKSGAHGSPSIERLFYHAIRMVGASRSPQDQPRRGYIGAR